MNLTISDLYNTMEALLLTTWYWLALAVIAIKATILAHLALKRANWLYSSIRASKPGHITFDCKALVLSL